MHSVQHFCTSRGNGKRESQGARRPPLPQPVDTPHCRHPHSRPRAEHPDVAAAISRPIDKNVAGIGTLIGRRRGDQGIQSDWTPHTGPEDPTPHSPRKRHQHQPKITTASARRLGNRALNPRPPHQRVPLIEASDGWTRFERNLGTIDIPPTSYDGHQPSGTHRKTTFTPRA